nr:hypothetical protein [Desulfuromonadales bacterium]NIR33891.1 hypothetical protein [Desulfuromonadales bacterium]NIS41416.1 hypothetical protein [Desulfuromonadales bacterium]
YAQKQNRYRVLKKAQPEVADQLMEEADKETATRFDLYKKLAELQADCGTE